MERTHTLLLFLPVITEELTIHMKANPGLSTRSYCFAYSRTWTQQFPCIIPTQFLLSSRYFPQLTYNCNFFHHAKQVLSWPHVTLQVTTLYSQLHQSSLKAYKLPLSMPLDSLLIPSNQFVVNSSLQVLLSNQPMTFIFLIKQNV